MKRSVSNLLSLTVVTGIVLGVSLLLIAMVGGSSIPSSISSFLRGGIVGSTYSIGEVLVRATPPLMLAALGVSVGFRTGFINIGAEGQIYLGAIAITWLGGMTFPSLPPVLMIFFLPCWLGFWLEDCGP